MLSSVYLVEYTLHQNLVIEIHTRNFDLHITVPSPNLAFFCRNLDYKPYSINHGHTLDILVSRDDSSIVSTAAVVDIGLCDNDGNIVRDHYAIRISINRSVKQPRYETISFRNYKNI